MKKQRAEELIQKHEAWIKSTLQKKQLLREENDWQVTNKILYLGEYKTLQIMPSSSNGAQVILSESGFEITPLTGYTDEDLSQLIETFYRQQAKKVLTSLTEQYASLLGVKYNNISIRKQKTRWGSCSSKGNLSYNVKMLCAPKEMMEYVVLHEVMHLRYFNHGKIFWQEIEAIMPDYKQRVNYFKQVGQKFML